jgi:hypothetical protein
LYEYDAYDLNGILGSGQNLVVGGEAQENTLGQSFNNLKISLDSKSTTWPINVTDAELALILLTEPLRPTSESYPMFDYLL